MTIARGKAAAPKLNGTRRDDGLTTNMRRDGAPTKSESWPTLTWMSARTNGWSDSAASPAFAVVPTSGRGPQGTIVK